MDIPPPAPPARSTAQSESASSSIEEAAPYTISARVVGGDRELWVGRFAMTPYGNASARLDVQDMDSNCPVRNDRFARRSNSVKLAVRPGRGSGVNLYTVDVSWTRPSEDCSQQGSRATGFDVQVELIDNETRVIEGDGGLRVELTRQP